MIPNWFQSLAVSTPRSIELQNETAFLPRHSERAKLLLKITLINHWPSFLISKNLGNIENQNSYNYNNRNCVAKLFKSIFYIQLKKASSKASCRATR